MGGGDPFRAGARAGGAPGAGRYGRWIATNSRLGGLPVRSRENTEGRLRMRPALACRSRCQARDVS